MCFRKVFEVNWKIKKNFIMLLPIFIFLSPFRFPSAAFIKQNASVQFYCFTINFYFWMFVAYFILWYLFSNIAEWLIFILLIRLCSNFWSGSLLSVFFFWILYAFYYDSKSFYETLASGLQRCTFPIWSRRTISTVHGKTYKAWRTVDKRRLLTISKIEQISQKKKLFWIIVAENTAHERLK